MILSTIFFIFTPFLILAACQRYRFLNKIGAIVLAYIIGVLAGNSSLFPENIHKLQDLMTMITIPLAIPLMLFSTNLKQLSRLAKPALISLGIGIVSVTIMIVTGHWIFRDYITEPHKISGLMVGVFTGGTPNLASLKLILDADDTMYLITHSADMIIGVFYLLFLVTVGKKVFSFLLGIKYTPSAEINKREENLESAPYKGIFKRTILVRLIQLIILAIALVGLSILIALLFNENARMAVIMLSLTTLSLLAAMLPRVNKTPKTFEAGMYFVLIFSVVVASMGDINNLVISALPVVYYAAWTVAGSLILQVIFSRLLRLDADTLMITSTALICSPPFVPMVAGALQNRKIVVPGLSIGIIGYALGNYLGYIIAMTLR
ncbi:DUF819 family protein [Alkalitalea saponilacus]|uniref:Uncharacterized membrane protein n=1 Tax=Alkalitalea saponilacus TaxID=889453 RepID=A0A1T5HS47_9BACT|nr:DUF819 family protein [Alkalitalea saponilacus]ASB49984.1 hypothetical protein CDL62_12980 [Alkalitalea saponilacus]SKC23509.1 Uncharacterized membrane protein [Alkalitalea saponilacus]